MRDVTLPSPSKMGFDTMRSFKHLMLNTVPSEEINDDPDASRAARRRVPRRSPSFQFNEAISRRCVSTTRSRFDAFMCSNISGRGGIWGEKIDITSLAGQTIIRDDYSPSDALVRIPSFQDATAGWSPPPSPTSASRPGSPTKSLTTNDLAESLLPSPPKSPVLTRTEKNALAARLFQASCSGDVLAMTDLIDAGAPVNSSVLVPGLFESFKPAKAGHLSPLAGAASHGHIDAVELLLVHGAALNPNPNQSASTPLHEACRRDDLDIVRQLLECGADVNLGNCYNVTPPMYAAKYSSPAVIALLLAHGPDLERRSFINTTALFWAAFRGDAPVARLFIEAGAQLNAGNTNGDTPLHCVVLTGSAAMVRLLLKHGADPLQRNEEGKSALDAARESGAREMVKLIEAAVLLSR